jgi:hypothetical protein
MTADDLDAAAGRSAEAMTARLKTENMLLVPRDFLAKALLAVQLGERMRDAQRSYFRTRTREDLIASKEAERAFDLAVAALDGAHRPATNA